MFSTCLEQSHDKPEVKIDRLQKDQELLDLELSMAVEKLDAFESDQERLIQARDSAREAIASQLETLQVIVLVGDDNVDIIKEYQTDSALLEMLNALIDKRKAKGRHLSFTVAVLKQKIVAAVRHTDFWKQRLVSVS